MEDIVIRGARQHNLKNITLRIPRNRLVVVTGVSGSGKSSLAFDTLFAEGQRRYVEALSSHARQFLQHLEAPDVDEIQGLSPAIAIEQKGLPRNPRTTVGTLTEIHDHLRLLYTHLGTLHCPSCGRPVYAHTIQQMVAETSRWPQGSRLLILAPLGNLKEKELPRVLKKLRREGFVRVRLDGQIFELDPAPAVPRRPSYRAEVLIDRLILNENKTQRLSASLELAAKMGSQTVVVARVEGEERIFTQAFRCTSCQREFSPPTPSLFSFYHPAGMCDRCKGLGYIQAVATGPSKRKPNQPPGRRKKSVENTPPLPPSDLDEDQDQRVVCPECSGSRLNETARAVRLGQSAIHEVSRLAVPEIRAWLLDLDLDDSQRLVAARPIKEIRNRLDTMEHLGLSYLSLDRSAPTLSGGEAQRIRLANQLGSPLSGVLYVLDEPSIGLHPRDHRKLLDILYQLRDEGNSVVVVEHDREAILKADHVVDIGPGAGVEGGGLIYSGPPGQLIEQPASLTGLYLSERRQISVTSRPRRPFSHGHFTVKGASGHNLKEITAEFPLGCLICVTGVSGSGKSTLVLDTLYRALAQRLYRSKLLPLAHQSLEGTEPITKVILIDQSPLGRTPRSTPATYTGLFSLIRDLFARLPEARARGYGAGRFSFNARGGRCEACKGEGLQAIEMYFLPDVYVTCPICQGSRYTQETLQIQFKGCSIADALNMTAIEAIALFENIPAIRRKLEVMQEVGLGYLRLGQAATTLSGGEAQRVKLAAELALRTHGKALYILDEPTTGLHFADIDKLLHLLHRLVDAGHTAIVIEHHLDVIRAADYVMDLGPEGGEEGGRIVAAGTPEQIAEAADSITGAYLREAMARAKPE